MGLDTPSLAQALRRFKERHGRGAWARMASVTGLSDPTIGRIAREEVRPTLDSWEKIYRAYPDEIPAPRFTTDLTAENDPNAEAAARLVVDVPVFDGQGGSGGAWSDAGYPVGEASEFERLPVVMIDANAFCVTIHGDSMAPGLTEGSRVLVVPSKPLEQGKLCFATWPGDTGDRMIKRYYRYRDTIILRSDNPAYPDIQLDPVADRDVRIFRVTWIKP